MNARTILSLFALGSVVALTACDNDPAKGVPTAKVESPNATSPGGPTGTSAGAAAPVAGTKYAFSNDGSKVEFVGAKVTGKHEGAFKTFSGTATVPGGAIDKGSVAVEIDVGSLATEDDKLNGHLKSPDFFDVEKFPKAKFTSTGIKAGGDNGATHTVTGNLELHGVTKTISIPATIKAEPDHVDVDADFAINRKDFGVVYPGKPDDLIKDEFKIKLTIRGKKAG